MFKQASVINEVFESLENNLNNNDLNKITENNNKLILALNYLNTAADQLDKHGFQKEASILTKLAECACEDKVTNVTSEEMVENLKNRGWPFNAADDGEKENKEEILEGADEFKREALEDAYLDFMLGDEEDKYSKLLKELDEENLEEEEFDIEI